MPEAPLAHAFVHVADIRVQSPKDRALAVEQAKASALAAEARGAEIERQRILAIITAPEAQYRFRTALHIALKTSMSVDEAKNLLRIVGKGTA